jgi:hypothetical protein
MDADDDDDDLHHGLPQITACLKALLSAGAPSIPGPASPPHTLAHAGQEARGPGGRRQGNLDEGEEWIPTAWDPIRYYCTGVREKGKTVQCPGAPAPRSLKQRQTSRSPSS